MNQNSLNVDRIKMVYIIFAKNAKIPDNVEEIINNIKESLK